MKSSVLFKKTVFMREEREGNEKRGVDDGNLWHKLSVVSIESHKISILNNVWGCNSDGRVSDLHSESRGFKSLQLHFKRP